MNAIINAAIAAVDAESAKFDDEVRELADAKAAERRERKNAQQRAKRAADAKKGAKIATAHVNEKIAKAGFKAPAAAVWQNVIVDGKTVQVAANLNPAEAEKAARALVGEQPKDVDRAAPQDVAKAERSERKQAAKLPHGMVKFALSTTAYGVLVASDLDARIIKALKASDKVRSAHASAKPPYHFPIMSTSDALACADVLAATAKAWEKDEGAKKGALKSVKRYVTQLREVATA